MSVQSDVRQLIRDACSVLSPGKRKACGFIVNNLENVAFMSAGSLARQIGVDKSLLVRLARDLGYSGFPAFQAACRSMFLGEMGKAALFERSLTHLSDDPFRNVIEDDIGKIRAIAQYNPREILDKAVDLIEQARRIRVIAGRTAAGPGLILAIYLNEWLGDAEIVTPGFGDMYDNIRKLGPGDLAVAISFSKYTRSTVEAAEFVTSRGCRLLAITDDVVSPLALLADVTLRVNVVGISYTVSQTPVIALVNALVHLVGLRKPDVVARFLKESDLVVNDRLYYNRSRTSDTRAAGSVDERKESDGGDRNRPNYQGG